jgi:hypothetical protein
MRTLAQAAEEQGLRLHGLLPHAEPLSPTKMADGGAPDGHKGRGSNSQLRTLTICVGMRLGWLLILEI